MSMQKFFDENLVHQGRITWLIKLVEVVGLKLELMKYLKSFENFDLKIGLKIRLTFSYKDQVINHNNNTNLHITLFN